MQKNLNGVYDTDNYAVYFCNSSSVVYFVTRSGMSGLSFAKDFTSSLLISKQEAEVVFDAIRELVPDYAITMIRINFNEEDNTYTPIVVKHIPRKGEVTNVNESKS